jgi:myo-inositol 2-dehydrogenase / D-chiro-inositol 1-dehydrogenase
MSAPPPLRLAYIGAGGFTNAYMYPQLHLHNVRLAAVCDLIEEKAQAAARKYGFEAVYTDFRRMLDEVRPEAVICVGGPKVHYEVGREVLARGYPLYVQKSPAPSSAATREMADLAAAKAVVCHVGFNIRSSEAVLRAKEAMAGAEFGPTTLVIVRYGLVFGATLQDAVMDQHCHAFDLARHLGGSVRGVAVERGEVAGDRGYIAALKFANGAVGTVNFTSGQVPAKEFLYFEVTGTEGHFLTCHDFNLRVVSATAPDRLHVIGNYGGALRELSWLGYIADLASFLDAVRGTGEDRSPIADTIETMELCEEAYRQLREQGAPA